MSIQQHVASQLVRQFHRAAMAHDQAEDVDDESAMAVLCDRINALASEVSFHPAGSPEAALYMAQILRADLDVINREDMNFQDAALMRRMERLAASIAMWIEQTSGIDRQDYRLNWYGGKELDAVPFGAILPRLVAAE